MATAAITVTLTGRLDQATRLTLAHLSQIATIFGIEAAITFDDFDRAERLIKGYIDTTLTCLGIEPACSCTAGRLCPDCAADLALLTGHDINPLDNIAADLHRPTTQTKDIA